MHFLKIIRTISKSVEITSINTEITAGINKIKNDREKQITVIGLKFIEGFSFVSEYGNMQVTIGRITVKK